MTALAVISGAAVLILAAGFWLAAWLINRPEGSHTRPSRLARAFWWCRGWAAWHRYRWQRAAARAWLRLRGPRKRLELSHEDAQTAAWVQDLADEEYRIMPAPETGEVMPSAVPERSRGELLPEPGLRVTWAGGARTSPALPPAVTAALTSGWAIHGQLADTAEFARITAGA